MIQSETGTSDVHFEKGHGGIRENEAKIKGSSTRQLAHSDCGKIPCQPKPEKAKSNSISYSTSSAAEPSISSTTRTTSKVRILTENGVLIRSLE